MRQKAQAHDKTASQPVQERSEAEPQVEAEVSPRQLEMCLARGTTRGGSGAEQFLALQRRYGNRQIRRMIQIARDGAGASKVPEAVEAEIESARGNGRAMEQETRERIESAFGADFSGVRLHTDARADGLGRALGARAFTTGEDVFFRHGEYRPETTGGVELLAHELTHVVQQGARVRARMELSQPQDAPELEAERVAQQVARMWPETASEKRRFADRARAPRV